MNNSNKIVMAGNDAHKVMTFPSTLQAIIVPYTYKEYLESWMQDYVEKGQNTYNISKSKKL